VIEYWYDKKWHASKHPCFWSGYAYRIRPEPKRETVTLYGHHRLYNCAQSSTDTHRITLDIIDGKPDVASIKMEALK
jgi:hypothetical protein